MGEDRWSMCWPETPLPQPLSHKGRGGRVASFGFGHRKGWIALMRKLADCVMGNGNIGVKSKI